MTSNDLFDYMRDATDRMQSEYNRIQKRACEDPGTAGDNGEENWAKLLRAWLPKSYHIVTKGRIMNFEGKCSPQIDIIVLSPSYPGILLDKKEYLEAGVIAAFECKLTLKRQHIYEAVSNAVEVHRLAKSQKGTPGREIYSRIYYGLLAHSHSWKANRSKPLENIEKNLFEAEQNKVQHPSELLDVICISDLATWGTLKFIFTSSSTLSKLCSRYQSHKKTWAEIQASGGVIEVGHSCFAPAYQNIDKENKSFTPIGAFLPHLLKRLAWQDSSLRPLAEYFVLAKLPGCGSYRSSNDRFHCWSLTSFSNKLAEELKHGKQLKYGEELDWNDWNGMYSF